MGAVLVRVVSSGSGKKAKMRVGYCGLGKLGLPCALASEAAGHEVVGYDPNPAVAEYIRTKQIPYREEGTPELLQNTKIRVVSVQEMVDFADLIFVAVQTPHNPRYEGVTRIPEDRVDFDYTYLIEACKQLNEAIEKNGKDKPVVVISTVLPGTLESKVIPHLGKHFKLCYNPFFIAMGTTRYDFTNPEFVLFGMSDEKTADLAEAFYKTIHNAPFYRCSIKSAELVKVAYNCYSEDTEVLTSGGWKLFPNVAEKDEILSLNPDTLVPEWVKPDKIVGRYHQGPMIRFQSRKDDVFVTPGHNMFIGTLSSKPANGKSYSYEWKLEKANEVIKRKSFAFLRHTNWDLKSPETVNLGFGEVPIELMTEFMAWYLAEGCTTKVSENSYQIIISQNRSKNLEKYNSIVQTVAALQAALGSSNGICQQESGVTFYHAELGEYLCQFGKSFDKYVPSWLKELGRPEIRLFLDVYNQADGSKQARTRFNGEPTGEFDRYYATSSEQMAADIGELIIKAGHFPSYRAYESELSNKPCNLIYELTGRTSLFQRSSKVGLKYEEVPEYEGMIYCAVLPKNHVFLTRRNGKCSWQGNTFISTKIAFVNNLMEICHHTGADVDEVTSALKLGKERLISTKYLNAGMGDGGGCHPRDNIALSWLSRKLGMTFDFHEAIMMAREKQTDFLANLVEKYHKVGIYSAEDFTVKEYRTLPVVILGKAFKEQTNLEVGSPAILLKNILAERGIEAEMYDPWVDKAEDKTVNPYANGPAKCFFIGTHHAVFRDYKFPAGSVVIDPWRMIPEQPGVFVFGVGKGHSSALAFGGFSEAPAKP